MDPNSHTFILKCARIQRDLTQAELAQLLGVSPISITSWETGRRNISPTRKPAVEAALGLTPGTLGSTSTRQGPYHSRRLKTKAPATSGDEGRKTTPGLETNAEGGGY